MKFKNVFNSYGSVEMGPWVFYHECNKRFNKIQKTKYGSYWQTILQSKV